MKWWFAGKRFPAAESGAQRHAVEELLDPYHGRASIIDGDRMMIEPG